MRKSVWCILVLLSGLAIFPSINLGLSSSRIETSGHRLLHYVGVLFPSALGFSYEFLQSPATPDLSDPIDLKNPTPNSENSKSGFPIYPHFQILRNFGYHIGDEIPLTLVIEAKKDAILDLVNLPHKGEVHGSFEVRDLKIHTENAREAKVYRIHFNLQTFKPVLAVDTIEFPPLDILYTTSEGKSPLSGEYQYKSLMSPPYTLSFSRTAAYFGRMKDIKGVLEGGPTFLAWGIILLGAFLWVGATGSWIWNWYLVRIARVRPNRKLTPEEKALHTITEAWDQYIIHGGRIKDIFSTTSLAFREYLSEVYHIPAVAKTFLQLKEALHGKPYQTEILEILGRCHAILYEGYIPGRREQEETVKQLKVLVRQIFSACKTETMS